MDGLHNAIGWLLGTYRRARIAVNIMDFCGSRTPDRRTPDRTAHPHRPIRQRTASVLASVAATSVLASVAAATSAAAAPSHAVLVAPALAVLAAP